jgi:uncharacterized protein (TIGR02466 family)
MHQPPDQSSYGSINLFQPVLWKYQYSFDWNLLETKVNYLFSQIKTNSLLEKNAAWSTVGCDKDMQPHHWPEFQHFIDWLDIIILGIARDLNFQSADYRITNSWINLHKELGETIEHNHNNSTFVVSAYLNCPSNSGNIVFKDPLEYHKSAWPIFPEQHLYQEVSVTTNDVLIFPGYLKHYVQPNLSSEDRYVITFNIQ